MDHQAVGCELEVLDVQGEELGAAQCGREADHEQSPVPDAEQVIPEALAVVL
jgi:hypothetical protein